MPLIDAAAYFAIDVTYTCKTKIRVNYHIGALTFCKMSFNIMTLSIVMVIITIHSR
jgi:hypothetical protein